MISTNTIPTANIADIYMSVLASLSVEDRLDLIAKLSSSIKNNSHAAFPSVGDLRTIFCGEWGDVGENKTMSDRLYITEAFDLGGLKVKLVFSDGTDSTVDVGDYIRRHPHPQYNKYLDPKKFHTFTLDGGNIVWGHNWDLIFPIEQLHEGVI